MTSISSGLDSRRERPISPHAHMQNKHSNAFHHEFIRTASLLPTPYYNQQRLIVVGTGWKWPQTFLGSETIIAVNHVVM